MPLLIESLKITINPISQGYFFTVQRSKLNCRSNMVSSDKSTINPQINIFIYFTYSFFNQCDLILYHMFSFNMINKIYYTEIPTKDETSKTTVQNLYCLFTYFHDILQLYTYIFLTNILLYF